MANAEGAKDIGRYGNEDKKAASFNKTTIVIVIVLYLIVLIKMKTCVFLSLGRFHAQSPRVLFVLATSLQIFVLLLLFLNLRMLFFLLL